MASERGGGRVPPLERRRRGGGSRRGARGISCVVLSCEEVFGPVSTLYRFGSIDDAIERANDVRFGLSAAVFTSSLDTAQQCVDRLAAGILHVNSQTAGADVHVPFGGTKESGYGPHEQGSAAVQFYTEEITVYQDL
jgi:acyl-CoA reductase-like NAD-dependent aldehyde dehydrogenase